MIPKLGMKIFGIIYFSAADHMAPYPSFFILSMSLIFHHIFALSGKLHIIVAKVLYLSNGGRRSGLITDCMGSHKKSGFSNTPTPMGLESGQCRQRQ